MPTSCSARDCRSRKTGDCKLTFHIFPKDPELQKRWIAVTGRKNWAPGRFGRLCSQHFEEKCFDRTGQTTRLRAGALPTIGKHVPRNRKKQLFLYGDPWEEILKCTTSPAPAAKVDVNTLCGRQLRGRLVPSPDKDGLENGGDFGDDPDDPQACQPDGEGKGGGEEAAANTPLTASLDHFYCRTQTEMDALLRRSELKIEYFKMKLDYLSNPARDVKDKPPPWPQFCRTSQLAAEEGAMGREGKAASMPPPQQPPASTTTTNHRHNNTNSEALIESDRQLREKMREAADLRRQIKTLQQKARRSRKGSKCTPKSLEGAKAKFIRCVVKIEPSDMKKGRKKKKKKKNDTPAARKNREEEEEAEDEEEEEDEDEEEEMAEEAADSSPEAEQIPSLQDSILSHTASLVVGQNGLLDKRDKQIEDLQEQLILVQYENKKLVKQKERLLTSSKEKERRRNQQIHHLQEVIEMLKERCPEYSHRQDRDRAPRHCSLCYAPTLRRCHRMPEHWASDVTEGQVSVPLIQHRPPECRSYPPVRLKSLALPALKFRRCPWLSKGSVKCQECRPPRYRGRGNGRSASLEWC